MLLQILAVIFGLPATIGTYQGLSYWEPQHWENVMAAEEIAVQVQTRIMEKAVEMGLASQEECDAMIREMKEEGKSHPLVPAMKFGHWVRERIISYNDQYCEIVWTVKETKLMIKILRDTLNHIEEEEKLNQTETDKEESEEYELVDKEIVELEKEKQEWELLLKTLRGKLENLSQYRK